jgi:hypothetical protein
LARSPGRLASRPRALVIAPTEHFPALSRIIQSGMVQMKPVLLAVAVFALCGCNFNEERGGPVQHEAQSIDLDKSEMARVDIKLGAGELELDGGSPKLMEAEFNYNIPAWKPIVHYDASSFRSQLRIEQPST